MEKERQFRTKNDIEQDIPEQENEKPQNTVAWIALAASFVAIVIGLIILLRPMPDGQSAQDIRDLQTQVADLRREAALSRSLRLLEDLQARIARGETLGTDVGERIINIRNDLRISFEESGEDIRKQLTGIDEQLSRIAENISQGTEGIQESLSLVIAGLQQLVR